MGLQGLPHGGDHLAEAAQQQSDLLFCGLAEHRHGVAGETLRLSLAQDLVGPCVRVLQVRPGVAGGGHHALGVEGVVLLQAAGQVGVLDRCERDRRGSLGLGSVQQAVQGDGRALAGGELLAVGAQHLAEAHVLCGDPVGQVAGEPRHSEDLLEVVRLRCPDDVDHPVGVQVADPVPDGCQVGAGVAEATGGVADDRWRGEALDEDHERPAVDDGDPSVLEVGSHHGEVIVVDRLPRKVGIGEQHVHALVGGVEAGQRHVDQLLPEGPRRRVARLQHDHPLASPVGELLRLLQVVVGPLVELFCRRQVERGDVDALFEDLLDEHAELPPPVADVVLRDDGVALCPQDAREAVADDRGTQVADVHLLRHVRR